MLPCVAEPGRKGLCVSHWIFRTVLEVFLILSGDASTINTVYKSLLLASAVYVVQPLRQPGTARRCGHICGMHAAQAWHQAAWAPVVSSFKHESWCTQLAIYQPVTTTRMLPGSERLALNFVAS